MASGALLCIKTLSDLWLTPSNDPNTKNKVFVYVSELFLLYFCANSGICKSDPVRHANINLLSVFLHFFAELWN